MIWRSIITLIFFLLVWQLVIVIFHLPVFILPSPWEVFITFYKKADLIFYHTIPTLLEIISGLIAGSMIGMIVALLMLRFRRIRFWLLPLVVMSQAVPVFAIAPLLVIWLGYGFSSKIMMILLMLFFPITNAFYDGLQRTPKIWLDMAKVMEGRKWHIIWKIRVPAALPNLASGIRMAAAIAPIGAIIGEWVGSSRGLGYLMLNASGRLEIPLMFACIIMVMVIALLLYIAVDQLLRHLITWE